MSTPKRIQRQRTKGWRTPLCGCGCGKPARYVGRPGIYGNPFSAMEAGSRYPSLTSEQVSAFIVNRFRTDLAAEFPEYPSANEVREKLAGHDLMCWCPIDAECHADVLLDIANGGAS